MSKDNYNNHLSKFIVGLKPNKLNVSDVAAKVNIHKFCDCPGSEPGKIIADIRAHLPGCRFRKRSSRYAEKTSVIPTKVIDGNSLGIAIGWEDF